MTCTKPMLRRTASFLITDSNYESLVIPDDVCDGLSIGRDSDMPVFQFRSSNVGDWQTVSVEAPFRGRIEGPIDVRIPDAWATWQAGYAGSSFAEDEYLKIDVWNKFPDSIPDKRPPKRVAAQVVFESTSYSGLRFGVKGRRTVLLTLKNANGGAVDVTVSLSKVDQAISSLSEETVITETLANGAEKNYAFDIGGGNSPGVPTDEIYIRTYVLAAEAAQTFYVFAELRD
jgi:hypothetical protein